MEYKKQIMKLGELVDMGYPKEFLMNAYNDKKQDFAWKLDMTKKNSPIIFDTAGLEAYRKEKIQLERDANKRMRMVI